ncbi:hypothetical protein CR513_43345, partial [Mucuna pruriens]
MRQGKPRERSISRQRRNTSYRSIIATISRGGALDGRTASIRKRHTRAVLAIQESKGCRVHFLIKNKDAFAWSSADMLGIDPNFLCHRLSIAPRTKPMKDPYQLPNIDRSIDGASGCGLLSFMNAYLGYNQIRMHQHDEAKTAFITDT